MLKIFSPNQNYKGLQSFMGFPGGSELKPSACNVGDLGSIPGLGRSPREEKGYPLLLYSPWGCKESDMTK